MFKPLILLLMVFCCNLMVSEHAYSQMSPENIKAMREGVARARQKAGMKSSEKSPAGSSSSASRNGSAGSKTKTDETTPSFKLFDVKPKSLLAVLDSDGDGQLSGKEIDFAADQLLRLDANDNGQIDVDELPGVMASEASMASEPSGFDPAYKGPGEQIYKTIAGFDADENGVLTRSEMRTEYRGAFRSIDSDGNREINPKELLMYAKEQ